MNRENQPLLLKGRRGDKQFARKIDKACIIAGYFNDLLLFGGLLIGGYLPILAPTTSVDDVLEHYRKWERGIQICGTMWVFSGITYPFFASAVSKQLKRIPGINPTLVTAWNMASMAVTMLVLIPGLFMCQAAYRLDRSPAVTSMLHDIIIIYIVVPFTPLAVQGWLVALAVYQDYAGDRDPSPSRHLFPRWVGWFSLIAPILMIPACAAHFVYSGPLAWNGVLAFWIPAISFGIQVNVMSYASFSVIDKELDHEQESLED
ncbi:uncharacterized protein E0L32_010978 [Thyridium curvatum]|uniref:Uncharacterized protein n=1 Tax=Thyridium curvatum TaxID=1093900 RepID=A0A507AIQ3_9PEZI|nr:uncharacterized protein E0L32_010978 [Thyridium curvatum]TPX07083.1 hypothetical protein E0L32_010978 [Thyridium curvatum]